MFLVTLVFILSENYDVRSPYNPPENGDLLILRVDKSFAKGFLTITLCYSYTTKPTYSSFFSVVSLFSSSFYAFKMAVNKFLGLSASSFVTKDDYSILG